MNAKKILAGAVAVAAHLVAAPAIAGEPLKTELLYRTAEVTVLLSDEDEALTRLSAEAEKAGGYFAEKTTHRLKVKIPAQAADAYLELVGTLGKVVENRYSSEDLTEKRSRLASQVESRKNMLARYLAAMGTTKNRDDLRTIEGATKDLVAEVEHGEGALRLIDHRALYATIDVSFKLRDRTPVRIIHENHFPWLGTVGLNNLLAGFAPAEDSK